MFSDIQKTSMRKGYECIVDRTSAHVACELVEVIECVDAKSKTVQPGMCLLSLL